MSHIIYKICIFHNFHKKNQIKNENQEKPKKKKNRKKTSAYGFSIGGDI